MSEPKFTIHYGLTVLRPEMHIKIVEPEPLTIAEWVHCAFIDVWDIFFPSFLFACSITAFRFAFGGFG